MPKKSPVGIFLAATAALATTTIIPDHSIQNHFLFLQNFYNAE